MTAEIIINEIKNLACPEMALHAQKFFRTGKGEYAEGDIFLGIRVPILRKIAKKYYKIIDLNSTEILLQNLHHEIRLTAIVILILKFQSSLSSEREQIFRLYCDNIQYINNWDLVDISAQHIIGAFLYQKTKPEISRFLLKLAYSKHLWSERISIVATFYFIKKGDFFHTFQLAEYFLSHKHDLIHKAVGWMLREVGKQDVSCLRNFLDEFSSKMPRTMLRYAIEKLSPAEKLKYMK